MKIGDKCFKKINNFNHFRSANIDDYNEHSAIPSCPITGDLFLVYEELFKYIEYLKNTHN